MTHHEGLVHPTRDSQTIIEILTHRATTVQEFNRAAGRHQSREPISDNDAAICNQTYHNIIKKKAQLTHPPTKFLMGNTNPGLSFETRTKILMNGNCVQQRKLKSTISFVSFSSELQQTHKKHKSTHSISMTNSSTNETPKNPYISDPQMRALGARNEHKLESHSQRARTQISLATTAHLDNDDG